MTWQAELDAATSIADPVERARALSDLLTENRRAASVMAVLRREAIDAALDEGMTRDQLASTLGVSGPRISQMRRAEEPSPPARPIVTGWRAERRDVPEAAVAITGSRSAGTSSEHIDAVVPALAELLMRRPYTVSHGPVGVGSEVMTLIADQHHPDELSEVRGIIGHPNVIRDAEVVLIVGGGKGTQAEADLALDAGKRVLPMPTSGGTAAQVYMRQLTDPRLRAWLPDESFASLATADGQQYVRIAESVITRESRS